jgi:hypothetical protein
MGSSFGGGGSSTDAREGRIPSTLEKAPAMPEPIDPVRR